MCGAFLFELLYHVVHPDICVCIFVYIYSTYTKVMPVFCAAVACALVMYA